jgi:thymidylate kinase
MKKEQDFLNAWFNCLNQNKIRYAILRNYKSLPDSCGGSDIDIWVKKEDYKNFVRITNDCAIANEGVLASYIPDDTCPRIIYQACGWGVQLDAHIGVAMHRGVPYIDDETIEEHLVEYNGIKVLSKEIDILISFLKEILNNKKCKEKYCIQAAELIDTTAKEDINKFLKAFSNKARHQIIEVLKNRDFSKDEIQRLGILCSKDIQSLCSKIKYRTNQIKKLTRVVKQPGYTIAFLGTDGSGKSTVINAITPILNEAFHNGIRYEHMRPNHIPSLAVAMGKKKNDEPTGVCSNPHGSKPSGFAGSLLRVSYYMVDYTWGYFRKVFLDKAFKTHIWLFDRYYYDYLIDPRRGRISLPKWILKFFGFFVPTPDIILCLGGDPEKIYARKPETSLEEVTRQTKVLKEFCNSNKKAVWIDTTTTPQESIDAAMVAIQKMMEKRYSKTKL